MSKIFLKTFSIALVFTLLVACSDNINESENGQTGDENEFADSLAQIMKPEELTGGKLIYKNTCQACHQEDGLGVEGAFPSLAEAKSELASIMTGVEGSSMIAFKDELTDQEIVDVMNYINNSWGKKFGRTTIKDVQETK